MKHSVFGGARISGSFRKAISGESITLALFYGKCGQIHHNMDFTGYT